MQKETKRVPLAMSYANRQARFTQEKNEFVQTHMYLSPAEMDEAIRKIARRWNI